MAENKQLSLMVNVVDDDSTNWYTTPTTPVPKTPNLRLRNRFEEAWNKAEKKFRDDTGGLALGSYDVKSKDSILKHYKQTYGSDSGEKKGNVFQSETLHSILNAVELVGSFAAQVVSEMFSPASMCFNAIDFLINIPRQIKNVYDALQDLFTEIARFLVKFKIYKRIEDGSDLGEEFLDNTNNLLLCFVDVCGTAVKFIQGGKWDRFKTFSSVVLLRDNKIQAALDTFRALCEASDSLANTVMLEHVMSSEATVNRILSSTRRSESSLRTLVARSNDEKTKVVNRDGLDRISRRLVSAPPREDPFSWKPQDNFANTLVALQGTEQYRQWVDNQTSRSTLVIWGPSGSGKSYMLDTIRDHLSTQREIADKGQPSIYVAKHNFDESRSNLTGEQSRDPNQSASKAEALKQIAYQVAKQSTAYTRDLSRALEQNNDDLRSLKDIFKLWKILGLADMKPSLGATLYVILDNVLEVDIVSDLKSFLTLFMNTAQAAGTENLKIKVVLAMNAEPQSEIPGVLLTVAASAVNKSLLAPFVDEEMRCKGILQELNKETRLRRGIVLERLTSETTEVSFSNIRRRLALLREAIDEDKPYSELSRILDHKGGAQSVNEGLEIIAKVEKSLSGRSLVLLNKLLSYILFSPYLRLGHEEIAALLELEEIELPIEPLSNKIRQQFNKIIVSDPYCVYINDAVEAALLERSTGSANKSAPSTSGVPRITLNVSIVNASEETVKKFFWDLNDQMSSGKFDFSSAGMQQTGMPRIHVDELDSLLTLVRLSFKIIHEGWSEKTQIMLWHAYGQLPLYLYKLKDHAARLTDTDRRMIGEGIMAYLTDPYQIKLHHETATPGWWIEDETTFQGFRFWLRDTETTKHLRPREQRWVVEATNPSRGKLGFLQDLTIALGEHWLSDTKIGKVGCYYLYAWIDKFIRNNTPCTEVSTDGILDDTASRSVVEDNEAAARPGSPPSSIEEAGAATNGIVVKAQDLPDSEKIKRAAAWVIENSSLLPGDAYYLALGQTCEFQDAYEAAISYYEQISEDFADHYLGQIGYALCAVALKRTGDAVDQGLAALAVLRTKADSKSLQGSEVKDCASSLQELGEGFAKLGQFKEALEAYHVALRLDPSDYTFRWKVLKLHCQSDVTQDMASVILRAWAADPATYGGRSPAESILDIIESFDDTLKPMCRIVKSETLRSSLFDILEEASRSLDAARDPVIRAQLQYLKATMLTIDVDSRAERAWKQVLEIARDIGGDPSFEVQWLVERAETHHLRYRFDEIHARFLEDSSLTTDRKRKLVLALGEERAKLNTSSSILRSSSGYYSSESFLTCLWSRIDMVEARRILKDDMTSALEILSDSDPENDASGISILSRIFCHLDDRIGVLTAMSLLDRSVNRRRLKLSPNEPEPELTVREKYEEGLSAGCDGCGESVCSSDRLPTWWCPFCPNFDLCHKCKRWREIGLLRLEICSQQHVSSYIMRVHPEYTEEELEGTNVRVDWTWVEKDEKSFTREGGRIIKLEDWVEEIRVQWGLPKPSGEGSRAQE